MVRLGFAALLVTVLVPGCYEGPPAEHEDTDSDDSGAGTTAPTSTSSGTTSSGPTDCIAGQQECVCLNGGCVGTLSCVNDICLPGPRAEVPNQGLSVLAGMRVPVEFEVTADEFAWAQVGGPSVTMDDPTISPLLIDLPADAAGQTVSLELTATRNTIPGTWTYEIQLNDASVENAFAEAETPPELGTVTAVDFRGGNRWIATLEGDLLQVDDNGTISNMYTLGGTPVSIRSGNLREGDNDIDVLYFADAEAQAIKAFLFGNQQVRTITDSDADGNPLGELNFVVNRGNGGDLVFANGAGGQIFYYEAERDTTHLLIDDGVLGQHPHAMLFGTDAYLYVGTLGQVWKVPILPGPEEGDPPQAGPGELYLDLGDATDPALEISGMALDGALNLFVGVGGTRTLYLARYTPDGQANVDNSWTLASESLAQFTNMRLSGASLFFATGAEGAVGRTVTGLSR